MSLFSKYSNVNSNRRDRESGTGVRRTEIQKDEAGIVVGDRQDRETGIGDRRTEIQKDEAGNVVGDRQDRKTGIAGRIIAGETCMNEQRNTIWHQVNSGGLICSLL